LITVLVLVSTGTTILGAAPPMAPGPPPPAGGALPVGHALDDGVLLGALAGVSPDEHALSSKVRRATVAMIFFI
jgi:hypothetical protein